MCVIGMYMCVVCVCGALGSVCYLFVLLISKSTKLSMDLVFAHCFLPIFKL